LTYKETRLLRFARNDNFWVFFSSLNLSIRVIRVQVFVFLCVSVPLVVKSFFQLNTKDQKKIIFLL